MFLSFTWLWTSSPSQMKSALHWSFCLPWLGLPQLPLSCLCWPCWPRKCPKECPGDKDSRERDLDSQLLRSGEVAEPGAELKSLDNDLLALPRGKGRIKGHPLGLQPGPLPHCPISSLMETLTALPISPAWVPSWQVAAMMSQFVVA